MNFFPKNPQFFDLFEELSLLVKKTGSLPEKILTQKKSFSFSSKAKKYKREGNQLRHQLAAQADSTFITPIDREDIHNLAKQLNLVLDFLENLIWHLELYQPPANTPDLKKLLRIIAEATTKIHDLVKNLKHNGQKATLLKDLIDDLHNLENQADDLYKEALAKLFLRHHAHLITLVKLKDIFTWIENIIDELENTADTINQIIIKNF